MLKVLAIKAVISKSFKFGRDIKLMAVIRPESNAFDTVPRSAVALKYAKSPD